MTEGKLLVYGARWCPDVTMVRNYLDRHGIAYEYCDIDTDDGVMDSLMEISGKDWLVPTLILPSGDILVNPSIRDLADKLGRPRRRRVQ